MNWLKSFFSEESGKGSSLRLYSAVALVVAIVLSLRVPADYGLSLTWLVAAFAPKSIKGLADVMVKRNDKL